LNIPNFLVIKIKLDVYLCYMKIVITESQLTNIKEMVVSSLPSQKLLKWFLDRVNHTFVFFDTETTGLDRTPADKPINQLTQIGAIATQINGETLRFFEIDRFNIKIKLNDDLKGQVGNDPDAPEDEESPEYRKWLFGTKKGILKYNHYDLENSESFEEERNALGQFESFLNNFDNVTLIAHNAPFDLKWIEFHQEFKDSTYEIIDSIDFFRNFFFPILERLAGQQAQQQYKYDQFKSGKTGKSAALGNVAKGFANDVNQLKEKLKGAHDAVVDCEITIEVLERGLGMVYRHLND
jgi:DNA polymerase III epsilon subunit-like protein